MAVDSTVFTKTSGYLEKKGKMKVVTSSWKKYWFVLEGRSPLLYYRSKDEYDSAITPCKGTINLGPPCHIKPIMGTLCFQLETRRKTLTLRAENKEEHGKWMQAILTALQYQNQHQQQQKSSFNQHSTNISTNNYNNNNNNNNRLSHFRYHHSSDDLALQPSNKKSNPKRLSFDDEEEKPNNNRKKQDLMNSQRLGGSLVNMNSIISTNNLNSSSNLHLHEKFNKKLKKSNSLILFNTVNNNNDKKDIDDNNRKSLQELQLELQFKLRFQKHQQNDDKNDELIVENEQYCSSSTNGVGENVQLRSKKIEKKKSSSILIQNDGIDENLYERISFDDEINDDKKRVVECELYDAIILHDRSSSDSSHCNEPKDTLQDNLYALPFTSTSTTTRKTTSPPSIHQYSNNNNNNTNEDILLIENAQYIPSSPTTKVEEEDEEEEIGEYAECHFYTEIPNQTKSNLNANPNPNFYNSNLDEDEEDIYEEVDKIRADAIKLGLIITKRDSSSSNASSTSLIKNSGNEENVENTGKKEKKKDKVKVKTRRNKSFFNKIITWKRKSKEIAQEDEEQQRKGAISPPINLLQISTPELINNDKLNINLDKQEVQVLNELQKILEEKKQQLKKNLDHEENAQTNNKLDKNKNEEITRGVNWRPVLPEKIVAEISKRDKQPNKKLKTIDEILEDLDKEKYNKFTKKEQQENYYYNNNSNKVKDLIGRFEVDKTSSSAKKIAVENESTKNLIETNFGVTLRKSPTPTKLPLPFKSNNGNDKMIKSSSTNTNFGRVVKSPVIKKKVDLFEKKGNTEKDLENVNVNANVHSDSDSSDNNLLKLLEDLAKVTNAPIMQARNTKSLQINYNASFDFTTDTTNNEWLNLIPIKHRRLSDPDYDIPRPHSSLILFPQEKLERKNKHATAKNTDETMTTTTTTKKSNLNTNSNPNYKINNASHHETKKEIIEFELEVEEEEEGESLQELTSMCPDSLEVQAEEQRINKEKKNKQQNVNEKPEEEIYAKPRQITKLNFNLSSNNERETKEQEINLKLKSLDVFIDSLEASNSTSNLNPNNEELSTIF